MEVIRLNQKFNRLKIKWLLKQDKLHDKRDNEIRKKLKSILKFLDNNDKLEVVYKVSKVFNNNNYGRIFGYHNEKIYGCLGSLSRAIRGYLADDDYIDIDIKRCHWYIIKYLIQKNGEFNDIYIINFINNYDDIIKEIIKSKLYGDEYCDYHSVNDKAKDSIFALLYTQPSYVNKNDTVKQILETNEIVKKVHNQIYNVLLPSLKEEYNELVNLLKFDKNEKNRDGKILSHILQHLERMIILEVIKYFENNGFSIGAIIHDGFLMYKNNKFSDEFLKECEKHIYEKFNGLEIKLVIKPFIKGYIPELPEDFKDENDSTYIILCNKLLEYVKENKIKKDKDGNIYKRSSKNKLHYEMTYINNDREPYMYLIEDVFENDKLFNREPVHYQYIVNFILNRNIKEFSDIKTDKDLIGFSNCVLNIRTLEIINLDDIKDDDDRVVRHYIDNKLDINNINTKKFDEIIRYQLEDEEAILWLYILIGRLFFKTPNDSLQVIPVLKGYNNTGKSLIGEILEKLFKPGVVGSISGNNEQTFGLSSFLDKEVLISMDAPEDMKSVLGVDLFKTMCSGENVNIPQKNKKAITKRWSIPIFLISNYFLNYEDKGGAIGKRVAYFLFMKSVLNPDESIKTYIIDNELPSVLYKACKLYKEYLDKKEFKTFEAIRPEYFVRTNEEYRNTTNLLYQFLTKPDTEDTDGNIYKIEFIEESEELFSTVQHEFKKWCKYNNIKYNKIAADDNTFNYMNLKKVVKNICKSCNNSHKRGCCENYSRTSRTTITVIKGIKFRKIENLYM